MKNRQWTDEEKTLEYDDFLKPELIADLLQIDWDTTEEVEITLSGSINEGSRQTYWEPGEPAHLEEFGVSLMVKGKLVDIDELITPRKFSLLEEQANIDALESLEDDRY